MMNALSKLFKSSKLWIPIASVFLGLFVGAIVMLIFDYNPIEGYIALFDGVFGNKYFTGETIALITPYIFSGLAVAFAFRAGLLNIGVEGQVLVGWLAAVWIGISFDLPAIIHLPLALIAAALAGAFWGFIPGILKARLHVHEVIVTIMLNYVALRVTNSLVRNVLSDRKEKTPSINDSASLKADWLTEMMDYSNIHTGIVLALIAALVYWYIMERTTKGFEMRAVGLNPHASQYAGMNVQKNIVFAMTFSGALAGLAGAMQGLGLFGYMAISSGFTNIGFDGIAIALLGASTAIGVVLASGLFGFLKIGALNMQAGAGVPPELVEIVTALIIFFVAAGYMIILFKDKIVNLFSKKEKTPKNDIKKEGN